jgi:hypothetical protein
VPFAAAEVKEAEILLFLPERVSIDPKGQLGIRVAELRRDPADTLPGS